MPENMHYPECEEQPEDMSCICEQIRQQRIDDMANNVYDYRLGNS